MEFAAAALSSIASGVSSAAGAVGSAVGATGAAAGAASAGGLGSLLSVGSLAGGILSGGASLLQMSQLKQAGREKALSLDLQANEVPTEIGAENVKAAQGRNSLRKALLDTIGERDAAYAASGVDLTFGTPAVAREQAVDDAETALTMDNATTTSRVARLNEKASNLRYMARQARTTGNQLADIAGVEGAAKILRRG